MGKGWGWFLKHFAQPLFAAWLPLGALGLLNGRRWFGTLWPIVLWIGLYIVGYIFLGVLGFHWYYVPLVPAVALVVGGGVAGLASWLAARGRWVAWLAEVGLALICLWPQAGFSWQNRLSASPRVASYQLVSEWLRSNTAPDSSVALLEIGVIGYQSQRPVVDMMGLVTPSMVGHLQDWGQVFYYAVTRHWPAIRVAA